jgi:hypothetical protein
MHSLIAIGHGFGFPEGLTGRFERTLRRQCNSDFCSRTQVFSEKVRGNNTLTKGAFMTPAKSVWLFRMYHSAFIILTFLCWSPLLYGSYGKTDLIFSIPSWAALALLFGAIMAALQWLYLFPSKLALSDDHLAQIVDEVRLAAKESTYPSASK